MHGSKWIVIASLVGACKSGDSAPKPVPAPVPAPPADAAPVAARPLDAAPVVDAAAVAVAGDGGVDLTGRPKRTLGDDEKITAEVLDQVYAQMASCPLVWSGFDASTCPEASVLHAATWGASDSQKSGDYSAWSQLLFDAAKKKLADPSASVRYAAAEYLLLTNSEEGRVLAAGAVEKEQDPKVLQAYAVMIGNTATFHPALAAQVIRLADHPDKDVRTAIFEHGMGSAKGVAGAYEVTARHAESEPDAFARGLACEDLGEQADPRAFDELTKLLASETDASQWDSCFQGLVDLWTYYENASEPAYHATIGLVLHGPHPAEAQMLAIQELGRVPQEQKDRPDEWKGKKFIKIPEITKTLIAAASAKQGLSWTARGVAVDALVDLGVKKSVLKAIRKTIAAKPEPDTEESYFAEKLDEAIAAAH